MKADLSRDTFNPLKHFTRALMQQGRVQLDADWNEQAAILLHYLQSLAADLIGRHGGPTDNFGFEVELLGAAAKGRDFRIGLGHYYVDGLLCEADSTPIVVSHTEGATSKTVQSEIWNLDGVELRADQYVELFDDAQSPAFPPTVVQIANPDKANRKFTLQGAPAQLSSAKNPKIRRAITYLHQPDYSPPEALKEDTYQVYLDVWERHICHLEDDSIREVALAGPDTASRAKLVWQVKVTEPFGGGCATVEQLNDRFQPKNRGRLKAMAKQVNVSTDPCIIPPDAQYRGPENQLYRVEIHRGGEVWDGKDKTSGATFKLSRENGAVVFALAQPLGGSGATTTAVLETLGRDDRFGLSEGDWVEVQDDRSVLSNTAGNLLQVQSIDRGTMMVTFNGTPGIEVGKDLALHPLLRRWDHVEGDPTEGGLQLGSDGAALVVEDSEGLWLELEDGVQIQFQKPAADRAAEVYRTGDYWLIPARTATGDVEWPREKDPQGKPTPLALPPHGVEHRYAPLAVVALDDGGRITDCRKKFDSVVKLTP